MAKRIILKETDLSLGGNPPAGYKYLGFDDDILSERTGATVSGIGSVGYKVYTALLSQSGTDAPTAIVLENTIGVSPAFIRDGAGSYRFSFDLAIDEYKLFYSINNFDINSNTIKIEQGGSVFYIQVYNSHDVLTDGLLYLNPIEIRVYN
jgi:hypothetical protein